MRVSSLLELIARERPQYRVFAALSVGAILLTGLLQYSDACIFQRVLGGINPLAAAFGIVVLGFVCLSLLLSRGGFAIYRKENRKGLLRASGLAALFGVIIIPADLLIVFPADINVPFPESLLFYPAVGLFAEILFHVLPLSLLLIVLTSVFRATNQNRIIWISVVAVALLEPVYQTLWMVSLDRYPVWAVAYDAIHVFAINLLQLIIFWRYDFVSMVAFRLVYYLFWHIGWGYFRLEILF
jgi:hypothetical protein